jgi:hypothetical protein
MRKIALVLSLAFGLASCAGLNNAYTTLSGTTVSPTAVYIAANAFDAVEVTATNYLKLKQCSSTSGKICRSPAATKQIIPAVRSGRVARTNLENYMNQNPGALGPVGLYNALTAATNTLQAVVAQYNIGG